MYLLIRFQVTKDDITVAAKTLNGFETMAVLNEDENTGNERTATKINAPLERMPAMFKRCTIGRKYDSCNTDDFWRVSRWCFLAN